MILDNVNGWLSKILTNWFISQNFNFQYVLIHVIETIYIYNKSIWKKKKNMYMCVVWLNLTLGQGTWEPCAYNCNSTNF